MQFSKLKISLAILANVVGNSTGFCQQVVHDARGFECGFISEKTKDGKSGDASCSNSPERIFSNASRTFSSRELCDVKEVFGFEDIKLRIDFGSNNVLWEREDGLAPFAISRMAEYYMRKENLGRQEALRKATERPNLGPKQVTYRIFYVHKGDDFVSYDPVTQGLPKEPKSMPVYTVTFGYGFGNTLYSLFVPDNGAPAEAILTRYWADGGASWVNLRFGKCRVIR
ncbi:hypothetical protein [Bradyrhizobium japonicum]|uniref:hypothetical protein n=1 Tax=Bradyrhizobium japonicum TaxID=375 RepID=UPI001B8A5CE8|nr:hypothetical protein [Bradyrhizobium japonicum]MBR0974324.1 hypothetical protein [Bradyrhizobium japonicum]